jgi:peptidoglycan/LPS O-acetylase OafA/YrhL
VKTFIGSGYNGVTLFFILSGFVLAWSYADRILPLEPRGLWSFFVARLARVYPMYLLALLVVILPRIMDGKSDSLMLVHALALQPWMPNVGSVYVYNVPGWSIGVEFFLYACFPLLILGLSKLRKNTAALLVTGVVVVAAVFALTWWFVVTGRADLPVAHPESAHRWLYRMPATRLGDFAIGIIAALLVRNYKAPAWLSRAAQTVGAGAILALMCSPQLISTAWSWDAVYMLPAALLLWGLAAGPQTFLARGLATKPMVLFGEASFAFYLLHRPLVESLTIATGGGRAWVLANAITFSLILLMAVGAHMVIERPAQKLLRRVFNRTNTGRPELAPAGIGRAESS